MPALENIATTWTEATLAANEFWQCQAGAVYVTITDSPAEDTRGVLLTAGLGLDFLSGDVVSYRRSSGEAAIIWREPRA